MKYLIPILSLVLATCTYAERLRMYTDRTTQENIIAGLVRIVDTDTKTGGIELDGVAIEKWSDIASTSTGAVTSIFGRGGAVVAQEGDYSAFYALSDASYTKGEATLLFLSQSAWNDADSTTNYVPKTDGTPVYSEVDPVWVAERSNYATGTPLYVETYQGDFKADGSVPMSGNLELNGNDILGVDDISINGIYTAIDASPVVALDHLGDDTNSVLMYKNVDMGGNVISNATYYGDGSGLTGIVETYQGTITGGVINAGSSDAVTANGGVLEITWNTNAVSSGSSSEGVTSINTLDGAVTLAGGDNVSIVTNGNTLTIDADGGGMTNAYTVINSGNVGANVTFNFGAGQVQKFVQTASVTNTIYSVPDSSNLWEMTALIYGNGLDWDWNTNSMTFLGGETITLKSNAWNTVWMVRNPLTTNTTVGLLE